MLGFGARALFRRAPMTVGLLLLSIVPVVLIYARFAFWHGDFAWGPRYVVFAVPVVCLVFVSALDRALEMAQGWGRRLALAGLVAVAGAGAVVQVAGSAFHWDNFIRISVEARNRWLSTPNQRGGADAYANGTCHVCIENLYHLHYLPQFQPIRGHLWLLRHVPFRDDWRRAEADAPWHPETSLTIDISSSYAAARVDWWILDYGRHPGVAALLVVWMALMTLAGIWLWTTGWSRARTELVPDGVAV
jgi:hypothetical protein